MELLVLDLYPFRAYPCAVNERSLTPGADGPTAGPHTVQAILQSAFELFVRQGYHGTSMRQVARAAGISPAAIYNHFASKEALFSALLRDRVPHWALMDALRAAQGSDAAALLLDALRRMEEVTSGLYPNMRLLFVELLEFQGRHALDLASVLLPEVRSFVERLAALDEGVRRWPPMIVARAILGLFMSYSMTQVFFRQAPGLEAGPEDLQRLGEALLHGLLHPPSHSAR